MTRFQQWLKRILPPQWAKEMEAESRSWMMRCPCGFERSIWDAGGVRWKAKGSPRRLARCPRCGQVRWHTLYHSRPGR